MTTDLPPIPPDVYWNADACNFYSFPKAEGMGDAFFRLWHQRASEFPTGPHAPNWCTNYRSPMGHDTCTAGVPYSRHDLVPFQKRPCFLTPEAASKPGAVACARLRCPTAVEIEMWSRAVHGSVQRLFAALAATLEWRVANEGKSATTSMPCPTCGAPLRVAIVSSGDMIGKCETPKCTEWSE